MTGEQPDPLFNAATRLLDITEADLVTTTQDLAEPATPQSTLGTLVAALMQQVGARARTQGADEEFVIALAYTVWIAAESMADRALATTAVHN